MPPLPATTSSMRMSESPSLIEPLVLPRAQYVPARRVLELFVPPTHQDPLIDRSHMPVEGAMKSHVKSVRASAIGSGRACGTLVVRVVPVGKPAPRRGLRKRLLPVDQTRLLGPEGCRVT